MFSKIKNLKLFIGFVIVGAMASSLDLFLLYVFTEFGNIWYFYSSILSYSIAVTFNFFANKYFNFKNKSKKILSQFSIFALIIITGLGINQVILYILVTFFNIWYMVAKVVAIVIVMFFNFFMHKRYTFRERKPEISQKV